MSTELIEIPTTQQPKQALADLRQHAIAVPVAVMHAALAEYSERRKAFREWLLAQLQEGLHYGFVPGTAPRVGPNGEPLDSKGKAVDPKSWRFKPSFYQAGADFVCDLMGVRPEFTADLAAWEQLGKPVNTFVFTCRLFSDSGKLLGEGHGARKVGMKGGDENNAIKMACKSAKVHAVLNVYGLSDLFSQDEPPLPEEHPNPAQARGAPKAPPREERKPDRKAIPAMMAQVIDAQTAWKAERSEADSTKEHWVAWCQRVLKRDEVTKLSGWTAADVDAVYEAIANHIA